MSKHGIAQTTGVAVGLEQKRGRITSKNCNDFNCVIKCPFGFYYASSGNKKMHKKSLTKKEKMESLISNYREVTQAATLMTRYGAKCGEARTLIMNILIAAEELKYYDDNEYIVALGSDSCSSTLERRDIKNRMSAFRQKFGLNNCRPTMNYGANHSQSTYLADGQTYRRS